MCDNEKKPELEPDPCFEKRELRCRNHTHENQEVQRWSRSHFHEKNNFGAGAALILRRLRSPVSKDKEIKIYLSVVQLQARGPHVAQ